MLSSNLRERNGGLTSNSNSVAVSNDLQSNGKLSQSSAIQRLNQDLLLK